MSRALSSATTSRSPELDRTATVTLAPSSGVVTALGVPRTSGPPVALVRSRTHQRLESRRCWTTPTRWLDGVR